MLFEARNTVKSDDRIQKFGKSKISGNSKLGSHSFADRFQRGTLQSFGAHVVQWVHSNIVYSTAIKINKFRINGKKNLVWDGCK